MQLPAELRAALDERLEGVSRKMLAERAERISFQYRDRAASGVAVRDELDALAYALTRSPATFGAVRNVLERLRKRCPGFRPESALDLGSGAGAASWAVASTWSEIGALTQVDLNQPLLALNRALAVRASCDALRHAAQVAGDVGRLGGLPAVDLVVLSYVLAELTAAQAEGVLRGAWERCAGALAVIEPGTPAGYARILAARELLLRSGGRIVAPCPHEKACQLVAPDWCHFAARIERSRDHRLLKSADVPWEDEKFSYVIAVREQLYVAAHAARILARPVVESAGITVKLCELDGAAAVRTIQRRDKAEYKVAKKKDWGDELTG